MHNLLPHEIWQRSTPTFWYVLPECMIQLQMLGRWLKCSTLFKGQGEVKTKPTINVKIKTKKWHRLKFFYTNRTEMGWGWHGFMKSFGQRYSILIQSTALSVCLHTEPFSKSPNISNKYYNFDFHDQKCPNSAMLWLQTVINGSLILPQFFAVYQIFLSNETLWTKSKQRCIMFSDTLNVDAKINPNDSVWVSPHLTVCWSIITQ